MTELQTTGEKGLATKDPAWGATGFTQDDILIPKLLLMQPLSKLVADDKASPGSIVKSTTGETMCKKGETVEVIPFAMHKSWVLMEEVNGKFEFRSIQPMTADNAAADLEWSTPDGKRWRRDRALNFFFLLPSDIAKEANALKALAEKGEYPDPDDALIPCATSFRRTSYGAGKSFATHFAKSASFNVPPAVKVFKLGARLEKNDKGTFYVWTIESSRKSSKEELTACEKWWTTVQGAKVKIDDSDEGVEAGAATGAVDDEQFAKDVKNTF